MLITALFFYLLGCGFFSFKSVQSAKETVQVLALSGQPPSIAIKLAIFLRLFFIVAFWPIAFGFVFIRELIRECKSK